jgi:hypothetical protein
MALRGRQGGEDLGRQKSGERENDAERAHPGYRVAKNQKDTKDFKDSKEEAPGLRRLSF